ncbi:MAG: phage tail tape measure protein [Asgard group archaeon]|nr:phage tail tape measure protein [Asgard group archaeon]
MSFDVEKEISEVKTLILKAELKKALTKTKDLLKKDNLAKEVELRIIVLQGEILSFKAEFSKSQKLADKVLKESEKIDNDILKADAYMVKSIILYNLGKFKECYEITKKGLEYLVNDEKFDLNQIGKTKVLLLLNLATLELEFGNFPLGMKLFDDLHEFAFKTKFDYLIGFALNLKGQMTTIVGDILKGEEYVDEGMGILEPLGEHLFFIYSCFTFATVKQQVRKFDVALEYHQKGIDYSLRTGGIILLYGFYLHSALIYARQYKLDKALEYNELALEHTTSSKAVSYINIGAIYLLKNEVEKAYDNFLLGLKDSKKTGHLRLQPGLLYHLVLSSLLLKKEDQAKKYLQELKDLSKESDFDQITHNYKLAEVLILKESTRMQDWFKAVEILEELIASGKLKKGSQVDALYHIVEIRLKELQVTADQEILTEVKNQIETIQTYAEDTKQFSLLANIYRLKSQLALVELNAKKAVELLITAKTIAEERSLQSIAANIKEEQAKLEQQQNMWNRLKEQKAPIQETLKEVHLDNSVKQLAKETVIEVQDERTGDVIEYRKLFALKI